MSAGQFRFSRVLANAFRFASWTAAAAAVVEITRTPNEAGAMFGVCHRAELRPIGGAVYVVIVTTHGETYFLGLAKSLETRSAADAG